MKKHFIIFFFAFSLNSVGQNYIDYLNQANEAEYQFVEGGDLKAAKQTFISLDRKFKGLLFKDNFYLAILYYLDNDSINGFKYMTKFIDNYGASTYELTKFKKCIPELSVSDKAISELTLLENKVREKFGDSAYYNKVIKPINDTINHYIDLDQKSLSDSNKINIAIQIPYLNYLKRTGIPNPAIFGEDFMLIFLHLTDKKMQELYKDFLLNEIKKGKVSPETYAIIVDKDLLDSNETIYGSAFIKSSTKTNKEQVLLNRKKIGLSPYYSGPNNFPRCRKRKS